MVSIKNDNAVAIGTVAAGGAATSILLQNKKGIENAFKSTFKADTYKKMGAAVKDSFKKEGKDVAKDTATKGAKEAAKKGKSILNTVKDAAKKTGKAVKDFGGSAWNLTKKSANFAGKKAKAFEANIDWAKVGKTAAWAAVAATAAIGVKKVYNYFADNE